MKIIRILMTVVLVAGINTACSSQESVKGSKAEKNVSENVDVYYFHLTARCVTCKAVEEVSKNAVLDMYGHGVGFHAYNLDEPEGKAMGEKLGVSGQTLLVVKGDVKINLTSEGFMNARTNPEKLKQILKEKIDPLI